MLKYLLVIVIFLSTHTAHAELPKITVLNTNNNVQAWLVEDHSQPLVALQISFTGGAAADPASKAGLSNLATSLFDEGAGARNSDAFQSALNDHAIQWQFSASQDYITGQFKVATKYVPLLSELLADALTKPLLTPDAIARMKNQISAQQKFQTMDAGYNANLGLMKNLFGNHPYGRPSIGTPQSLASITQADLQNFWRTRLAKDNLKIAIVGDITPAQAQKMLQTVFGSLPAKAAVSLPPALPPQLGRSTTQKWQGAQATIMVAQAGPARQSSDWWALRLVDYVLGGGSFESRLMTEIREKNGLTYGVSTNLMPLKAAPLWVGQAAVAPPNADKAKQMIVAEWQKLKNQGLTAQELADAKTQLTGSLSLALGSTSDMASIMLQMQRDNLPLNALNTRAASINAVTLAQTNAAAKTWLTPDKLSFFVLMPSK